jgi:small subunit ribosomal protein S16
MDSRAPRDGRTLDEVGLYHPIENADRQLRLDEEKIKGWISKGAQPTDTVRKLLNSREIRIER